MTVCQQPNCLDDATATVVIKGKDDDVVIPVCDTHRDGFLRFFGLLGMEVS
ncbi:MAG TPA: hypothetical protein VFP34_00200 [Microlunatus sp.]|nr:hypothetical protein [Microlunatus sp.]